MRYIKTINLWDQGIHSALVNGQLKLQSGQWIKCGNDSQKSRFVSVDLKSKTINAVHGVSNKQVMHKYRDRVMHSKLAKIRGL